MRILGIDPGEKNIGIAVSDPTGTIASPLTVLEHVSRPIDAAAIAQIAAEQDAKKIVVGVSLDIDGKPTFSGRRAKRLAAAVRSQTDLPVVHWDEWRSTQTARGAQIALGTGRKKRSGHMDELAAVVILQSYLNTKPSE